MGGGRGDGVDQGLQRLFVHMELLKTRDGDYYKANVILQIQTII